MLDPRGTSRRAAGAAAAAVLAIGLAACGSHPKHPGCHSDKDCKAGLVCGGNQCVACNQASQCAAGQQCTNHACVARTGCTQDRDCTGGKVCDAGACKPCAADSECGPGGTCKAGACTRAKRCTKDTDCADALDCIHGYCLSGDRNATPGVATCMLQTVYFAFDKSAIQPSARDRLNQDADCIAKNKAKNVFVIGHTDSQGTEEYNIALSERRAQAVADFLSRLGTDPARMQIVPKGETEPTGLGAAKDRRVEFKWH